MQCDDGEFSYYNLGLEIHPAARLEIHPAARKHRVADQDIARALANAMTADEQLDDTRLYIGPSRAGDLLEVVTIVRADNSELAIHAMKMRTKYRRLPGEP